MLTREDLYQSTFFTAVHIVQNAVEIITVKIKKQTNKQFM